jgi:hypothetical protein
VDRPIIAAAREKLLELHTCVLLGPTGIGKSVAALAISKNRTKHSFWLEGTIFDPTTDLTAADMVVISNLSADDQLLAEDWLCNLPGLLIVTTTSRDCALRVLSDRGLADRTDAVIEMSGFTTSESVQFFNAAIGDKLTSQEKEKLAERLCGAPIALQAVPDLILGRSSWIRSVRSFLGLEKPIQVESMVAFLPESGELDVEAVSISIMRQWIEQFKSSQSKRVMRILCRVSTLGMTLDALAYVCDQMQPTAVKADLASAVERGFVRVTRNHRFPSIELFVPHDILRNFFLREIGSVEDGIFNTRYVEYLEAHPAIDPSSQIDAMIAGMRSAFGGNSSGETFADQFGRFSTMLEKSLQREKLPAPQYARIAALFEQKISAVLLEDCSSVISIAQSVGFLAPSALLAEIIWAGAQCRDSWGRGASIRAAVHHWIETGRNEIGVKRLEEWFEIYCSSPEVPFHDPFGDDDETDIAVDLDIAAATGGLCALGEPEMALSKLEVAWALRQRKHSHCTIAHHTILVGLIDSKRPELIGNVLLRFWGEMPESDHKSLVHAYLVTRNVQFDCPFPDAPGVSPYVGTVARAAHNETFRRFVADRQPLQYFL